MKLRTSPYKTPFKAARLALALAAARAIVILQELKREQPLVLIKLPRLDEIAREPGKALKSLKPWPALNDGPELPPNACLKTLQPSALTAASRAESPTPHCQRVRLPHSSAVKLWALSASASDEVAAALA